MVQACRLGRCGSRLKAQRSAGARVEALAAGLAAAAARVARSIRAVAAPAGARHLRGARNHTWCAMLNDLRVRARHARKLAPHACANASVSGACCFAWTASGAGNVELVAFGIGGSKSVAACIASAAATAVISWVWSSARSPLPSDSCRP